MPNQTATFNELTVTFTPSFGEFITLYRGVERVWISGAPFIPEEDRNKDGILFAEMEDGAIQTLGPVSAFFYAQKNGFIGTFEEWVQLLLSSESHATAAAQSAASALSSKNAAAESAASANTSKNNAATSATNASTSASQAATSATNAATSASNASTSETNAASSASSALSSKNAAQTSATNASNSAASAASSATTATNAKDNAVSAKTAAESAKTAAETAKQDAITAKTAAETAQTAAVSAQTAAESAKTAAQNSQSAAATSASSANSSALDSEAWAVGKRNGSDVPSTDSTYNNNAKYYAMQSAASASAASTSETNAATSKNNAATSEAHAAASERNAATSEANASGSAAAAASSAASALSSKQSAQASQEDANAAKVAAETAQQKAETAISHYPRIKSNDNWETWDVESETWQDTGHKSMAEATTTYAYQNSTSGTVVPSGTWTNNPEPQTGKYLWIRIRYTWTNGSVDNFYNVSYIGVDGTGSVNSVNGLAGDVLLDGTNIYVDNNAQVKETMYGAITRIGTSITNAEIDALF